MLTIFCKYLFKSGRVYAVGYCVVNVGNIFISSSIF